VKEFSLKFEKNLRLIRTLKEVAGLVFSAQFSGRRTPFVDIPIKLTLSP
jgi:hypothetical protein